MTFIETPCYFIIFNLNFSFLFFIKYVSSFCILHQIFTHYTYLHFTFLLWLQNKNLTSSNTGKTSFIVLLAATTFYNFEYSILTGLAILLYSIYEKKLFYFITSAVSLITSICFKIFSSIDTPGAVKYLDYFAESSYLPTFDLNTFLFICMLLTLFYFIVKIQQLSKINSNIKLLIFIIIFLTTKVLWINSSITLVPCF